MKIENTRTTAGSVSETHHRKTLGTPTAEAASEVHLSALAAQLQSTGEASTFDAKRVAEITQAIAEGHFKINSEAIADRLIAAASELVASQRS